MGTELKKEYAKSVLPEEAQVNKIKEESLKEYESMKTKNKTEFKTVLLIAGTMLLISLIARVVYNTGKTASTKDSSNKKLTNTVNIELKN